MCATLAPAGRRVTGVVRRASVALVLRDGAAGTSSCSSGAPIIPRTPGPQMAFLGPGQPGDADARPPSATAEEIGVDLARGEYLGASTIRAMARPAGGPRDRTLRLPPPRRHGDDPEPRGPLHPLDPARRAGEGVSGAG